MYSFKHSSSSSIYNELYEYFRIVAFSQGNLEKQADRQSLPAFTVCCVEAEAVHHILLFPSWHQTFQLEATYPLILSLSHTSSKHTRTHTHTALLLRSICSRVEICSNSMGVSHPFCMGDWSLFVNSYYAKILSLATLHHVAASVKACLIILLFFPSLKR